MRIWQQLDLEEAVRMNNISDQELETRDGTENIPKRQYNSCSHWTLTTIQEGDSDPHQTAQNIQVTESMDCGNGVCSIGQTETKTMTIRFTAGAKLSRWISAGFRVEQSASLSTTKTCFADNDWVAVWNRTGRTSYKVRNGLFNSCTDTRPYGDVFLITSPNSSSKNGGNPYCVRGKRYIRDLGYSWNETPVPGKP